MIGRIKSPGYPCNSLFVVATEQSTSTCSDDDKSDSILSLMNFRRGLSRLLVIAIIIWEILLLLLMMSMRGEGDTTTLIAAMLGGPILAFGLLRAFFWILEGFKGSPLE